MNRFEQASPSPIKYVARILPIVFFAVILVVFVILLGNVSEDTADRQMQSLETALEHDIAQCYALEGHYPADISYLEDHYGLTFDHDSFVVQYTYYGENLYPDYVVTHKSGISFY